MNALAIITEQRAAWEAEEATLKDTITALCHTYARSIAERETQLQLLRDYSEQQHEIRLKITCADELVSAILAATTLTTPADAAPSFAASTSVPVKVAVSSAA